MFILKIATTIFFIYVLCNKSCQAVCNKASM